MPDFSLQGREETDKLPRMKCANLCMCAGLLAAAAAPLYAGSTFMGGAPQEGAIISLHVENDMFVGDDDNYTSGVRIGWMSGTTAESRTFSGALGTVLGGTNASASWRRFMGMNGSPNLRQQWGLNLTQLMYTPEQKASYPLYNQHPYVGNLTLGLTALVKNEDRANSLELQLGTTGSPSLAKGSQHFVHKLWGMDQWPGWSNQLPAEMTANVFFKRYYRLRGLEKHYSSGWETDALAYWHADAGTVKVQAGGGISFRFGYNLGNTSPENSIRGATSAAPPFVYNRTSVSNWGYYGYVHGSVRAVAHDLYLDGTVFHSSPEYVNKYPVVAEWGYGIGVNYKRTEFLFGLHYISKEYTQQESIQCVGVLQLRHTF